MAIKEVVQKFVSTMDSLGKVYELFRVLGYPDDKLLDPAYIKKTEEFDFAREERSGRRLSMSLPSLTMTVSSRYS